MENVHDIQKKVTLLESEVIKIDEELLELEKKYGKIKSSPKVVQDFIEEEKEPQEEAKQE